MNSRYSTLRAVSFILKACAVLAAGAGIITGAVVFGSSSQAGGAGIIVVGLFSAVFSLAAGESIDLLIEVHRDTRPSM